MPQALTEVIGSRMPPPGVRGGDTRIFADQPMQPAFNINNAMNTFNQNLGQRVASGQMTMDQARAAQAEMTALQRMPSATREQATDVAQRQMQVGPYAARPVTAPALSYPMLGNTPPMAAQPAPMPQGPSVVEMAQLMRQPGRVDNSTFMAGDPNFRFGQTPQRMAPNAQGMAMGGLMRKYGGMC